LYTVFPGTDKTGTGLSFEVPVKASLSTSDFNRDTLHTPVHEPVCIIKFSHLLIPEPMKKKIGSKNQSILNVVLTTQIMKILPSHQPVSIE